MPICSSETLPEGGTLGGEGVNLYLRKMEKIVMIKADQSYARKY